MTDNTFIEQYCLDDLTICDELIQFYKEFDTKHLANDGKKLGPNEKKCSEIFFNVTELNTKYLENLKKCANEYIKKYSFCNSIVNSWGLVENIKIQHYLPSEAYYTWHCERDSANGNESLRHLAWMTYLNDVDDGGETEFYYQNIKIKPKKGLTLIWPADWTHTHRGIPSMSQEKYIITSWFNFIK